MISLKRFIVNWFYLMQLACTAIAIMWEYFRRGPGSESWSFIQHFVINFTRELIETPFEFELETLRKFFLLPSRSFAKNCTVKKFTIPTKFRLESQKLIRQYFEKQDINWDCYDEETDWSKEEPLVIHWLVPYGKKLTSNNDVFVYMHGGAFLFGDFTPYYRDMSVVADEANALCVGIDFRLLPEHPAPCQLEDVLATILYLTASKTGRRDESGMGFDFGRIAIAGDSAGGNITAAFLHLTRELGLPIMAGAVLLSPYLDMTNSQPSHRTNASTDTLTALPEHPPDKKYDEKYCDFVWRTCYKLGDSELQWRLRHWGHSYCHSEHLNHPIVSPLYDPNVRDLPPMLFEVGGGERLRDECILYAQRIDASNAEERNPNRLPPATLHIYDEMPHCFNLVIPSPQSEWMLMRVARFLRHCFAERSGDSALISRVREFYPVNTSATGELKSSNDQFMFRHRTDHTLVAYEPNYRLGLVYPRMHH